MTVDCSLRSMSAILAKGDRSCIELVLEAFDAIDIAGGQGRLAYLELDRAAALAHAHAWDIGHLRGHALPPLAGIPFSVKDCIAVAGTRTRAGSRVLENMPRATVDAPIVEAFKALGAVCIGKTNMTEFAYSALGNNTHYGTPFSDAAAGRIAGGSSSGAAVSVAEGMAMFALGTDTSGSCRIPAAFCGVAGFRPTIDRYCRTDTIPLAPSFDSVGTLAACCDDLLFLDELLYPTAAVAQESPITELLVPDEAFDDIDPGIARAFEAVVDRLHEAPGLRLRRARISQLAEASAAVRSAQIVGYEAYAWHRKHFQATPDRYDPRVAMRLRQAALLPKDAYDVGLGTLQRLKAEIDSIIGRQAAILLPTVPIKAPCLDDIVRDEAYLALNARAFSLTAIASHFDLPSVSLCGPCAVMLIGGRAADRAVLAAGAHIEKELETLR